MYMGLLLQMQAQEVTILGSIYLNEMQAPMQVANLCTSYMPLPLL